MRKKEVYQAIKIWGLRAKKVKRVRGIFKVKTDRGYFALKPTADSEKRLYFFDSVLRQVYQKGFKNFAHYIPTPENRPFGLYDDTYLVLHPWIRGKEIKYRSLKEAKEAVKTLAFFHYLAQGYEPEPEIFVRDKQGKWVEKFARRLGDIEFYLELAEQGGSEFDKYFLKHGFRIIELTTEAFKKLRDSCYSEKVKVSQKLVQICHGDPASRNFIIDKKGRVYLIDFDSMKYDLPITDLWRFLRRFMVKNDWDLNKARELLHTYTQVTPLDRGDYELLAIFLTFPEKIWRVLRKYYEKRREKDWSEKKYLYRLKKLLNQLTPRENFLKAFTDEFLK